jgi:hypothetical protein
MRKNFTILFFVVIFSFLGGSLKVLAQDASSTATTINARILPTVWYSTLSVNDGDSIKIYAGTQNNSDINFTGTATFYVDDKEISTSSFSSTIDSLKDVSTDWAASSGAHNIQVKISTSLPANKILVSNSSDVSNINIIQKVTPITTEAVETTVLNTASTIISKTDDLANTLADNIDNLKKPIVADNSSINLNTTKGNTTSTTSTTSSQKKNGIVLGASTGPKVDTNNSTTASNSPMDFVFNFCLGILSFLVRNWKWSLGGIVILFLLFKFFR